MMIFFICSMTGVVCSGFFSSSETGLMAINKYRLRHLANKGHRGAKLATNLLARPDRLLGLILLGNNIVNIFAATIATIIAFRLYGEVGLVVAPIALSLGPTLGVDARPFVIAACFAASAAFLTPMSYQTNLMVMGPGGYRPSDYLRCGLPLAVLVTATALLLIPQIWAF